MPVILITGLAESEDVVRGLKAGANDYVVKPLTLPVLFARVNVWIQARANYHDAIRRNEELSRAKDELRCAYDALQQKNDELESFSSAVSHDLRAPLRAILGFTEILVLEHAAGLDSEGADLLGRVKRAGERMDHLVIDLLRLARVSRHELKRSAADLSGIAATIIADLRRTDPQRRVEVRISQGITADADATLMAIALENLLSNAWKFTSKRIGALIEFTSQRRGSEENFLVRDNGAGFDMDEAARLFNAFHRLHTTEEFPGTGVGLATVRRIIDRHGGRIWAESKVGAGATFYFTLSALSVTG
jgi:signal transduction histidine kinase